MLPHSHPSVSSAHPYNKPLLFDPSSQRLYEQGAFGIFQESPLKKRMALCESICLKILCAILPISGVLGGAVFFANISVAPVIAMSFCAIATSCAVVVIASKILLYAFMPSYENYVKAKAYIALRANELDDALVAICALIELEPEGHFRRFLDLFLAVVGLSDHPDHKRFKMIDGLYLELATTYAERNNYQMALACMPSSQYCDQSRKDSFLARVKAIEGAPSMVQKLTCANWERVFWDTNTGKTPSDLNAYQITYKYYLAVYGSNCDPVENDDDKGHAETVFGLNENEPSSTVKLLRLYEWEALLCQSFKEKNKISQQEMVKALR